MAKGKYFSMGGNTLPKKSHSCMINANEDYPDMYYEKIFLCRKFPNNQLSLLTKNVL